MAGGLIDKLTWLREQELATLLRCYPDEPWSAELEQIDRCLATHQDQLRAIAQRAEEAHQQSIAPIVEAVLPK